MTNQSAINLNAGAISDNRSLIGLNSASININSAAISELRSGNAALAAIPDLYLNNDETWTLAGGISAYDDGAGGSEVGFGGGLQVRSKASDPWAIGVAGTFAGDVVALRLQGRIGG